ncbi:hypothetical protein [Roseomonas chloroacetimidivorans]
MVGQGPWAGNGEEWLGERAAEHVQQHVFRAALYLGDGGQV